MSERECKTQDEADAAASRGDLIVWRGGHLVARGSARVVAYDSASVVARDSASVYEGTTSSPLRRDRPRIVIGPLGSRNATLGASIPADGSDPIVYAGCWTGTLTDFAKRVDAVYPDGQFGTEYRAAIAMIRAIAAIPQEG